LGHNSKAVHHAYSKHAEVTVPSLDDWEKGWQENPQSSVQPKLLPVDFQPQIVTLTQRPLYAESALRSGFGETLPVKVPAKCKRQNNHAPINGALVLGRA
jgi:hypothetical protein